MAYVVDTGHKENFGRFATCDAPEAVGNTLGCIAAYAAVHGIGHTEEFVPLAAVGEAVAKENYVGRIHSEAVEKRRALVVELSVFLDRKSVV